MKKFTDFTTDTPLNQLTPDQRLVREKMDAIHEQLRGLQMHQCFDIFINFLGWGLAEVYEPDDKEKLYKDLEYIKFQVERICRKTQQLNAEAIEKYVLE